jgi:hypothetical protein
MLYYPNKKDPEYLPWSIVAQVAYEKLYNENASKKVMDKLTSTTPEKLKELMKLSPNAPLQKHIKKTEDVRRAADLLIQYAKS